VTLAISVGLGGMAIRCIMAARYVRSWYHRHGQGDPYLRRLADRDTRVARGGALILGVIGYSLLRLALPALGLGPLVPPFGALLIALPLVWMMWGPIDDERTIKADGRPRSSK
jgi:hypothetical protein